MVSIGDLAPADIWMSEGKLLVLKGSSSATSRQGYYDPWEPLDDYQVGLDLIQYFGGIFKTRLPDGKI